MQLNITPNVSVGDVVFGMSKVQVRAALGEPTREFFRGEPSEGPSWQYQGKGIIVSFDPRETCDAVQLGPPSDPVVQGFRPLSMPAAASLRALRQLDSSAALHNQSLISHRLGVSIYAPELAEHPDWPASSVLVFRPDYYQI